jgi:integrase/recombinase XerC
LRHTIITRVERHFGYAVARAFAGHSQDSGDVGATTTYINAELHEVAEAVAALTEEPHPLPIEGIDGPPEPSGEGQPGKHPWA